MARDVTVQRLRYSDGRYVVFVGERKVGSVIPSDRRWIRGWRVEYIDGRDLGDQPRKVDAVASLVSFATSPLRMAQ